MDNVFLDRKYSRPLQRKLNFLMMIRPAKVVKRRKGLKGLYIFLVNLFLENLYNFTTLKLMPLLKSLKIMILTM